MPTKKTPKQQTPQIIYKPLMRLSAFAALMIGLPVPLFIYSIISTFSFGSTGSRDATGARIFFYVCVGLIMLFGVLYTAKKARKNQKYWLAAILGPLIIPIILLLFFS